MYAIFISGGKKHKAIEGQTIRLEKINKSIGKEIKFQKVLMYSNGMNTKIGQPNISHHYISAKIIKHGKSQKIKIIKFNRRKHYKKQQGHRQNFTDVVIMKICHNSNSKEL